MVKKDRFQDSMRVNSIVQKRQVELDELYAWEIKIKSLFYLFEEGIKERKRMN